MIHQAPLERALRALQMERGNEGCLIAARTAIEQAPTRVRSWIVKLEQRALKSNQPLLLVSSSRAIAQVLIVSLLRELHALNLSQLRLRLERQQEAVIT